MSHTKIRQTLADIYDRLDIEKEWQENDTSRR